MRLALALALLPLTATAGVLDFSNGWREQRLALFSSNEFTFAERLGVVSEDTVSLVWTRVDGADRGARAAAWDWSVTQSVAATDLTVKGGDDRNLSIFFVFLPEAQVAGLQDSNIRDLLGYPDVRVLQYTWGGTTGGGAVLPSPYLLENGRIVALRPAGTGAHSESIDLAADYARAFGTPPTALVGLAVSADSDDTGGRIVGEVGPITLR